MQYIQETDYAYIMNKYHDAEKPFNLFHRFIRRDEIFSPESGMDGDAIREGIWREDAAYRHLPHPIRKAYALQYVLKNTRISCDARDRFPAVNTVDRPLNAVVGRWRAEVFGEIIPEVEKRRAELERAGTVTVWPDYDHSVPVWGRLFSRGFAGVLRESEEARSKKEPTAEQDAFYEGICITYGAVIDFVGRLEERARATEGSERMAEALSHIKNRPPETFYEALLLIYIYFIISEHIDILQVRSLSNFDRELFPFFERDLQNGVSEEEIRTDLAYFMLQFTAIGNYWNQPVYLGGENADGTSVINPLSYLFLDVYGKMGLYNPKIQIKVADSTPKEFLCRALDMIRSGRNSIVFVSDATVRRALERVGISPDAARTANITGCYEYSPIGSYEAGMNYLNLLKPLEYALHEGRDGVSGVLAGLSCPPPSSYATFRDLYDEYKRQLLRIIDITCETVDGFERYLADINPLSLLSATFPTCIERAQDAIGGGSVSNGSHIQFGFVANIADSLAMLEKYVFERGELTLPEFVAILDKNFEGEERLRRRLQADREKYGNNKERPDRFAAEIVSLITSHLCGRPNARGGIWNCGFHIARMSYEQGKVTAASPDGRLRGEELSKNLSASMGQNRDGATAAVLSITKIDATAFTSDAALDLGLLPSAVKGEDGLAAMYGLLMTFCHRGGHALHINVFDADTLRDAQAHPERYGDLQIRVSGWNVLWNNIPKEEQDGFIRQAEGLV